MLTTLSEGATGSMRLVVVIGNTTTTLSFFGEDGDPLTESLPTSRFTDSVTMRDVFREHVDRHGIPCAIAVCSVVPEATAACASMLQSQVCVPIVTIASSLSLPFRLDYGNPQGFGADRIALCAWSRYRYEGKAVIAVDIGTAITFDVLGSDGVYRGGLIMPGIDVMASALHARTAQLPLVEIAKPESLLGRSTTDCIRSGIFWGVVRQIDGLVDSITDELIRESGESSVVVLATGGNSRRIASEIRSVGVIDELAVIRGSDLLLRMNSA